MVREKIVRDHFLEVIYTDDHWKLLRELRKRASEIIRILLNSNIKAMAYGSIARGDVWKGSDIDVVIFQPINPFKIEMAIEMAGMTIYRRELIIATPRSTPKGYIYLDPNTVITFPLHPLMRNEEEFFLFGGILGYPDILDVKKRVPGVDKRLVLIKPTENGHIEESIIGKEGYVARLLGISIETVMERRKMLTKRDEKGRTGVYVKRELAPNESFDQVLKEIIDKKPAVRRMLRERNLI